MTPDTLSLYASGRGAVSVLRRRRSAGRFRQRQGPAGCVEASGRFGCQADPRLAYSAEWEMLLAPDGSNAYLVASPRDDLVLLAFRRAPRTGALSPITGPGGCVTQESRPDCTLVPGRVGYLWDVVFEPEGRAIVVVGSDTMTVVRRAPATGAIGPVPAPGVACFDGDGLYGCQAVPTLRGLDSAVAATVDAHAHALYAHYAPSDDPLGQQERSDALVAFHLDPATGMLAAPTGPLDCLGSLSPRAPRGCTAVGGLQQEPLALSFRDGTALISSTRETESDFTDSLAVFRSEPGAGGFGPVSPVSCWADSRRRTRRRDGCRRTRGMSRLTTAALISPDGRNAVVGTAYYEFDVPPLPSWQGVLVFRRDRVSGRIHQRSGPGGCLLRGAHDGCSVVPSLEAPVGLAFDPRARWLLVAASPVESEANVQPATLFAIRRRRNGALRAGGHLSCASTRRTPACTRIRGLAPRPSRGDTLSPTEPPIVSPDGRFVFLTYGGVAAFSLPR